MRKKVFITGGMIALFLILSSSTAFAANSPLNPSDIAEIKQELAAGKPVKDVLVEHQITLGKIRGILAAMHDGGYELGRHKLSNTQIATIATKLGLDVDQVQNEIAQGETLHQILQNNNITLDDIRAAFGQRPNEKQGLKHLREGKTARFRHSNRA